MSLATEQAKHCRSCGAAFHGPASFCTRCGAARPKSQSASSSDEEQPTQPLTSEPAPPVGQNGTGAQASPAAGAPGAAAWNERRPPRAPSPPSGARSPQAPSPAPGPPSEESSGHPGQGWQQPPAGYQPPAYDGPSAYQVAQPGQYGPSGPPPNYPGGPTYGFEGHHHPAVQPPQRQGRGSGILIAAIGAGVVAVLAIIVVVYVAASGNSSTPTRLVSAPAVTSTAAANTEPARPSPRSGGHGDSSHPQPAPVITRTAPRPAPSPAPSPAADDHAVSEVIQRHFSLITNHEFSAAYALLAPSLKTGESSWVAAHEADGIYNVSVAVKASVHSPSSATATIVKMTTLDGHGCKNWTGDWGLTKLDGDWRISESDLTQSAC
jgi:hypothetical protein